MVRISIPCQERISFPSWSVGGSELSAGRTRRGREARFQTWVRRGALLVSCFILSGLYLIIFKQKGLGLGSDRALNGELEYGDIKALGLENLSRAVAKDGNPWRGAGRRRRHDLLVAVSGCGGSFRPAAEAGSTLKLRYVLREMDGKVVESASKPVSVALGSGQIPKAIEHGLQGMCAGEVVRTVLPGDRTLIALVEGVRHYYYGDSTMTSWESAHNDELEQFLDSFSRVVQVRRGRRGASCNMTCARTGLFCVRVLFRVINNCPRLRSAFKCRECVVAPIGTAGADMPAWVSLSAPRSHARGACLVSPSASISSCTARYEHTKRLCPCLDSKHAQKLQQNGYSIR